MVDTNVYLDGAQRLRNVIRNQFGSTFKAYFLGSPEAIPEAALPCIVFHKIAGQVTTGKATMSDDMTEQVLIHIILNGKDGFGAPDNDDTVERQLFTLVEGRDPQTGYYLPNTILYAIRHNLTLDSTVLDHAEDMNYSVAERDDQPTIYEAIITVSIQERITVLNRR